MIDDILVHGKNTTEEHDECLERVLRKPPEAGLTLNKNKWHFSLSQVQFFGQVIDESGVYPDPEKI